jgi:hypothetical protein
MAEIKRCGLCNTFWPQAELDDHGLCPHCAGDEEILSTAAKSKAKGKKPQVKQETGGQGGTRYEY